MYKLVFHVKSGQVFTNALCFDNDVSSLHKGEDAPDLKNPIFTVDSSAVMRNAEGEIVGKFYTNTLDQWVFGSQDESFEISFGERDLLKTEVLTYKHIINNGLFGYED